MTWSVYLLYRADGGHTKVLGQLVGEFTSLAAAQSARDWDALRQLEQAHGRRVELGHAIVDRSAGGEPLAGLFGRAAAGLAHRCWGRACRHGSVALPGGLPGLTLRPDGVRRGSWVEDPASA